MNIHISALLWSAVNFIVIFGIVFIIFYLIHKVKIMYKRIENIENILMQEKKTD